MGLLGHVRKVLMLMPDSLAHMVVGEVVQHFSLIAMAHNKDIIVRTAAIRVSLYTSKQTLSIELAKCLYSCLAVCTQACMSIN